MDDREVVSALQAAIADRVGCDRYELWFGRNARLSLGSQTLLVEVANAFCQDWLRANFRRELEAACEETLGRPLTVEFRVEPSLAAAHARPAAAPATDDEAPADEPTWSGDGPSTGQAATAVLSPARPATKTKHSPPQRLRPAAPDKASRRPLATLESFVVGPCNRLAHASAQMVAQRPGELSPLLLHGATGTGKTHLLEGIWSAVGRGAGSIHAMYLSAEQFTSSFLEALRGSGLPSFRRKCRGVEMLIIDDLQFLGGKRATLIELQQTIDALLREGKQLVFSADRPLAELAALGPELVTRLAGGMVCPLEPPDHATRLGIARLMARRVGLELDSEVLELVATHFTHHARELSGAVHRLLAAARINGRPLCRASAEEALAEMIRHHGRAVRLPDIERAVCEVFGLAPQSLQSAGRSKTVSQPRMLAMWLARKHTRAALSEIGDYFGHRTHSTVISAHKTVSNWVAQQSTLRLPDKQWSVDEAIRRVEATLRAG